MGKYHALVVDDESTFRTLIQNVLKEAGYSVDSFSSARELFKSIGDKKPDIVVSDIMMPEMDGIELLKKISEEFPDVPMVMTTASDSVNLAIEAMKLGAFDYFTKPIDIPRFLLAVNNAITLANKEQEVIRLKKSLYDKHSPEQVMGNSEAFKKVMTRALRVASSNVNVLIAGETGTGKEVIAKIIHYNSDRKNGPFVDVNCAALPETLLESELFGHEKGAFTGAEQKRIGKFEQANNGTVFLDEIGDMPLSMQPKLLRVLQDHTVTRIGGSNKFSINIRMIAATNKNLEKGIQEKQFREDLYFRLSTVTIFIPPLRERKEDIIPLADYFLTLSNKQEGKDISGFTQTAIEHMVNYGWPGNIRELENSIAHAVLMCEKDKISIKDLPPRITGITKETTGLFKMPIVSLEEMEIAHIKNVLEKTNGNLTKASTMLGIDYSTLHRKLKQYNLK